MWQWYKPHKTKNDCFKKHDHKERSCHANLSCGNLSNANLSGANLSGANLSGANLSHANLFHANLTNTNLTNVDLGHVDLRGTLMTASLGLSQKDILGLQQRGAIIEDVTVSSVGALLNRETTDVNQQSSSEKQEKHCMVKSLPDAIPKSNFNQPLQQLINIAQQHPPQSHERQQAISELVNVIVRSHRLYRPLKSQLKNRFKDALNKYMKRGITQQSKKSGFPAVVSINETEYLEDLWQKEEACSKSQYLRRLIEEDPDGMFKTEHIQGKPSANFQSIILDKIWGDKTWEEIAEKLQISSVQTLSSFYNRSLKKFSHFFLKYLQD